MKNCSQSPTVTSSQHNMSWTLHHQEYGWKAKHDLCIDNNTNMRNWKQYAAALHYSEINIWYGTVPGTLCIQLLWHVSVFCGYISNTDYPSLTWGNLKNMKIQTSLFIEIVASSSLQTNGRYETSITWFTIIVVWIWGKLLVIWSMMNEKAHGQVSLTAINNWNLV